MVLTVLDQTGQPNSSLMHYAIDDHFAFYLGTRRAFGKYKALQADPRVAVAVVQESMDPLQVVDVQGRAEEISSESIPEMHAFFESKNPSKHYVKGAEDFTMFKITPSGIRWLDATSGELEMHDVAI